MNEEKQPLKDRLLGGLTRELSKAGIDLNPNGQAYKVAKGACELAAEMTRIPEEIEKAVSKVAKENASELQRMDLRESLDRFYEKTGKSLFELPYLAFYLVDFALYMKSKGSELPSSLTEPTLEKILESMNLDHKEVIVDYLIAKKAARDDFHKIIEDLKQP